MTTKGKITVCVKGHRIKHYGNFIKGKDNTSGRLPKFCTRYNSEIVEVIEIE